MSKFENEILCGDCLELIGQLDDNSVHAVVTSPPYATQRESLYSSISEDNYPTWFTNIMTALKPKMTPDGSVLVVIRANIANGTLSDYVLKTRLQVREAGWIECDELIWLKPDAPPLGSLQRPRRLWENILWFSPTNKPYVDLKACGNPKSKRVGFQGSTRFGLGDIISGVTMGTKAGTSKTTDVFLANVADIDKGVMHPAMYPVSLCSQLIQTFSKEGEMILDPFVGSGSTLLAAEQLKRKYIGMDMSQEYVDIAKDRLQSCTKYRPSYAELNEDLIFDS